MHPKVLIVMTTPYSTSDSSRTLDAYFHFWEKNKVAQVFSRNWIPNKGHCEEMYQITDSALLRKWLHKVNTVGRIYHYSEMRDIDGNQVLADNSAVGIGYKLGAKHLPIIEILRGMLWRKKYWCTENFLKWLDGYKPECIVYNFSNHLFTQQIALFVAKRFNIPIVAVIGDDYYFNDRFSLSPAYLYFRYKFKKLTEQVLSGNCSAVYCSDKIRDKYNNFFGINGKTVYINSSLKRRAFRPINKDNPKIVYFGSIRLGRNNALLEIADALKNISLNYKLEVYSNDSDEAFCGDLKKHQNVYYGGAIPYTEVQKKIAECDIFVIAEGFREEDINFTRYSLSTKASDSLASGTAILTYGPEDAGVVSYMKETKGAMVCTGKQNLQEDLIKLINDETLQKALYDNAILAFNKNHSVESSTKFFESILAEVIQKQGDK